MADKQKVELQPLASNKKIFISPVMNSMLMLRWKLPKQYLNLPIWQLVSTFT